MRTREERGRGSQRKQQGEVGRGIRGDAETQASRAVGQCASPGQIWSHRGPSVPRRVLGNVHTEVVCWA